MESSVRKNSSKNRTRELKATKYKQFIGNQIEGQGFADRRKKKIQYEYLKLLKKENRRTDKAALHSDATDYRKQRTEKAALHSDAADYRTQRRDFKSAKSGRHMFSKSHDEYERRKQVKLEKKQLALKKKKELEAALETYRQKKKEKFKKLCKKTYKGQPVMKERIEHLLEKIQRQVNQT